jgi:hypothetical protein
MNYAVVATYAAEPGESVLLAKRVHGHSLSPDDASWRTVPVNYYPLVISHEDPRPSTR